MCQCLVLGTILKCFVVYTASLYHNVGGVCLQVCDVWDSGVASCTTPHNPSYTHACTYSKQMQAHNCAATCMFNSKAESMEEVGRTPDTCSSTVADIQQFTTMEVGGAPCDSTWTFLYTSLTIAMEIGGEPLAVVICMATTTLYCGKENYVLWLLPGFCVQMAAWLVVTSRNLWCKLACQGNEVYKQSIITGQLLPCWLPLCPPWNIVLSHGLFFHGSYQWLGSPEQQVSESASPLCTEGGRRMWATNSKQKWHDLSLPVGRLTETSLLLTKAFTTPCCYKHWSSYLKVPAPLDNTCRF